MAIRLAHDPIMIQHGNSTVRLRPSLRAGLLIAQRYSIEEIEIALGECSFTTIGYLLEIGARDPDAALSLMCQILDKEGYVKLQLFTPALTAFVSASMGLIPAYDADTDIPQIVGDNEFDFVSELTALFEFATGWLCWTPSETWAATPAEITIARRGHFAMLNAIHGTGEKSADDPRDLPSKDDVKNGIARLRSLSGETA